MPDRTGTRQRYEDLIDRAEPKTFHHAVVMVAALDDVIASKQWANRPKDIEALPELLDIAHTLDIDPGVDL